MNIEFGQPLWILLPCRDQDLKEFVIRDSLWATSKPTFLNVYWEVKFIKSFLFGFISLSGMRHIITSHFRGTFHRIAVTWHWLSVKLLFYLLDCLDYLSGTELQLCKLSNWCNTGFTRMTIRRWIETIWIVSTLSLLYADGLPILSIWQWIGTMRTD